MAAAKENFGVMSRFNSKVAAKENVGVIRSCNSKVVISAKRNGRDRSLEFCLRLADCTFMCLSIPTTLESLLCLSKQDKKQYQCHHHHDEYDDKIPSRSYDITADRFPFIDADFKDPFPLPGTTCPLFESAVVGRTLYILGGDRNDIEGLDDIENECCNLYPYSKPRRVVAKRKKSISPPPPTPEVLCGDDWFVDFRQTTFPSSEPVWDWDDEFLKLTPKPTPETTLPDPPPDPTTTASGHGHVGKALRTLSESPRNIQPQPSSSMSRSQGVTTALALPPNDRSTITVQVDTTLRELWESHIDTPLRTPPTLFDPQPFSGSGGFLPWDIPSSASFTDTPSSRSRTLPKQIQPLPFTVYRDDPPSPPFTIYRDDPPSPVITTPTASPSPSPSPSSTLSSPTSSRLTPIPEFPDEPIKGICHNIWTFDLDNPHLGWSQGKSLISPRIFPILVPYQGKLYAFGGNHPSSPTFAEVYDPISATWTALPPPPFRRLPYFQMHVVPLNGWNKLWVFGTHRHVDYTFDVLTQRWHKFSGARVFLPHFTHHLTQTYQTPVSALTPQHHMVVYWVNHREQVYAYNLSTNQIFKGIISGGPRDKKPPLVWVGPPVVLHHLRHDLFCLKGYSFLGKSSRMVLHVIILQISLKTPPKSSKPRASSKIHKTSPSPLTAAVLACFACPTKGKNIGIDDIYLMSEKVHA